MPNKVLAVIEDLFFTVKINESAKHAGLAAEFVKSEIDAIDRAKLQPSVIVIDLNCTAIDPLRLIGELKSDPEYLVRHRPAGLRVVIAGRTGSRRLRRRVAGHGAGAVGIFAKHAADFQEVFRHVVSCGYEDVHRCHSRGADRRLWGRGARAPCRWFARRECGRVAGKSSRSHCGRARIFVEAIPSLTVRFLFHRDGNPILACHIPDRHDYGVWRRMGRRFTCMTPFTPTQGPSLHIGDCRRYSRRSSRSGPAAFLSAGTWSGCSILCAALYRAASGR